MEREDCWACPDKPQWLDLILQPYELTLAKLGNGGCVSTDNWNAKFCVLLIAFISKICVDHWYSQEQIKVFKGDCWQHLWNVWIGAVVFVEKIPWGVPRPSKTTCGNASNLLCCYGCFGAYLHALEKCFWDGANYPKGVACTFVNFIYNPLAHVEHLCVLIKTLLLRELVRHWWIFHSMSSFQKGNSHVEPLEVFLWRTCTWCRSLLRLLLCFECLLFCMGQSQFHVVGYQVKAVIFWTWFWFGGHETDSWSHSGCILSYRGWVQVNLKSWWTYFGQSWISSFHLKSIYNIFLRKSIRFQLSLARM